MAATFSTTSKCPAAMAWVVLVIVGGRRRDVGGDRNFLFGCWDRGGYLSFFALPLPLPLLPLFLDLSLA